MLSLKSVSVGRNNSFSYVFFNEKAIKTETYSVKMTVRIMFLFSPYDFYFFDGVHTKKFLIVLHFEEA